jgi:DNA-binding NarL/FixJ family response regulator
MARVVSIAEDLMLASRVDAMLTAAGHHVVLARSLQEASLDGAELIVADLDVENPEALVGLGVPVLGYYSHVDVETRQAALAAGVDLVVPRSRMSRELPELAEKLLAG